MPAADWIHLAGEGIHLMVDRRTGAIARLESTATGWRVQDRPELAAGFRLLIPLPGRRNNLAYGERQEPPEIQQASDSAIVLSWREVRSEHGGSHPIGITQRIGVGGRRVLFETTIDNRSDRVVENVWAPCFGDLRPPAPDDEPHNVRSTGGQPHHPYAVYLRRDTGEPALAIANYADESVSVEADGIDSPLAYRLVGDGAWRKTGGRVDLPARSVAVAIPARSLRAVAR